MVVFTILDHSLAVEDHTDYDADEENNGMGSKLDEIDCVVCDH